MFIVGISLLSLKLRSIVAHVHKRSRIRTIWTVPWGWGREEGNVQSGLIRMLRVWWEERSSSFPNADPTSRAAALLDRGHCPLTPPSSWEIVQVCFLSRCLPHHTPGGHTVWEPSVSNPVVLREERVIFSLNQRLFPFVSLPLSISAFCGMRLLFLFPLDQ